MKRGLSKYSLYLKQKIHACIKDLGPISNTEICQTLEIDRRISNKLVRFLRDEHAIHIKKYKRHFGAAGQRAPMYVDGPGEDARLPRLNLKRESREATKRYQRSRRALLILKQRAARGTDINIWTPLGIK